MRTLLVCALLVICRTASAETRAVPAITREGLVGSWEAVVQDQSMATEVYQMIVSKDGDAHLIQLIALGDDRSYSKFFGRATSIELADGNIKIHFVIASEHIKYCDWVEIQGYAVAEADTGAITGKIVKHRSESPYEWSEPVTFKKGRWIHDLERVSVEARRILLDPKFKEGHAVSTDSAKSP